MREIRTYGSAGAPGEQSPGATQTCFHSLKRYSRVGSGGSTAQLAEVPPP
jgi:hypothetical protein